MSGGRKERRTATVNMVDVLQSALAQALEEDPRTLIIGEDVGTLGGVFRVTAGLKDRFGPERVVDSPLAEAGLMGVSVGLALNGFRPIVEIQFDGFVFPALNQLLCHVATMPTRLEDPSLLPMVIRIPVGGRIRAGELHGESPETYFVHRPELRVVAASTAETAGALLLAAVLGGEPGARHEPKPMYRNSRIDPAAEQRDVPLDRARLCREGGDALVVAYGPTVDLAEEVSDALRDDGVAVAVLDLVSLAPLDVGTVLDAVASTGRVVVVTEAVRRCSLASEVASLAAEQCFDKLKAAPLVVSSETRPYPPADVEEGFFPDHEKLTAAVRRVLA